MSLPSVHYQNKCKVQTPENTLNIGIKKKNHMAFFISR